MKTDLKDMWEALLPIKSGLRTQILSGAFLTGSRIFGGFSKESDIDYVIQRDDPDKLYDYLMVNGLAIYGESRGVIDEYRSFYIKFKEEERPINLLIMDPKMYLAWKVATDCLVNMRATFARMDVPNIFQDKSTRVRIFESIWNPIWGNNIKK